MDKISYAFGKDYLLDWGLKEALREIFQNYIDYGEYGVHVLNSDIEDMYTVHITNNYSPKDFEFLRLGNSSKSDGTKIGHHGEGLKAAFLIFGRENLYFTVMTNNYFLNPDFSTSIIGETLDIVCEPSNIGDLTGFATEFNCPKDIYDNFINSIITEKDIIYTDKTYGDLLHPDKGQGNIYCGKLFVCNIKGLNYSYNIKPNKLRLDRDRKTPRDFDLDYATSQILTSYRIDETDKVINSVINYNSREYQYSGFVPESDIENIEAINTKGGIQYLDKTNNEMIINHAVINTLNNHPKFNILKTKSYRTQLLIKIREAKRNRTITLLKLFKKNYCGSEDLDMNIDIDVIINRFKTK